MSTEYEPGQDKTEKDLCTSSHKRDVAKRTCENLDPLLAALLAGSGSFSNIFLNFPM